MRFSVVNLGCRVNRVESDTVAAALEDAGWRNDVDDPDVVIVNSCTVTADAAKKTRKSVRHALSVHPEATVVVTGCAAVIDAADFTAMDARVRVLAKNTLVDTVLREYGSTQVPDQAPDDAPGYPERVGDGYPTRVGVKIQDGCDAACTYCIVHVARGPATSVRADDIEAQVVALEGAGVREIVLTGIDLGAYRDGACTLSDLCERLLAATDSARFRLSSIEPRSVDDRLIDLLASSDGRLCRHLHLPVQSGSTRVLRNMARPYDADGYRQLVDRLRRSVPGLALSTDVIVGFPGEDDDDFADTLALVEHCGFSKVHAFRYSRRRGTPAASMPDQVPADVVAKRYGRLVAIAAEQRLRDAVSRLGTVENAIVEEDGIGTTESHYRVRMESGTQRAMMYPVRLTTYDEDGIFHT